SEMPEQEEGLMRGFQLWVNLRARDKMTDPRCQDIAPERIPEVDPADGVHGRVSAGRFGGATGPVPGGATDRVYLDVALEPGAEVTVPLPAGHNAFAYVFDGAGVHLGTEVLNHRELAVLSADGDIVLRAGDESARLLVVAGKPLKEPVARYGPFV